VWCGVVCGVFVQPEELSGLLAGKDHLQLVSEAKVAEAEAMEARATPAEPKVAVIDETYADAIIDTDDVEEVRKK
jgi:hypothetical protein